MNFASFQVANIRSLSSTILYSFSDLDREVVGIALSYFDRFVSHHTSIAESLFQLVAMTSLYIAVKLHSTRKISVESMVSSIFSE